MSERNLPSIPIFGSRVGDTNLQSIDGLITKSTFHNPRSTAPAATAAVEASNSSSIKKPAQETAEVTTKPPANASKTSGRIAAPPGLAKPSQQQRQMGQRYKAEAIRLQSSRAEGLTDEEKARRRFGMGTRNVGAIAARQEREKEQQPEQRVTAFSFSFGFAL